MKFVEYVPDHILRNYLKVGQKITILKGALVHVQVPEMPTPHAWDYTLGVDHEIVIVNFLPGYTEVYANKNGVHPIHNHQVVWTEKEGWTYHSVDINDVKEIRDAA